MKINEALKKIRRFFRRNKRLPTYQEMAVLLDFASKNAAYKLADKLIEAGYLERDSSGHLVPKRLFAPLPNSGIVRAGFPTVAEEDMADVISFDEYLIENPEATFVLKVAGDSMIDAGIHEGDLVLVERTKPPKTGNIVVANIDNEWTMKYFDKEQGKVVLIPANKAYQKIYPKENLEIAGVVISVIRKYN